MFFPHAFFRTSGLFFSHHGQQLLVCQEASGDHCGTCEELHLTRHFVSFLFSGDMVVKSRLMSIAVLHFDPIDCFESFGIVVEFSKKGMEPNFIDSRTILLQFTHGFKQCIQGIYQVELCVWQQHWELVTFSQSRPPLQD